MKRLVSILGLVALLTSALLAAPKVMPNAEDLTGKWSGSFVITMVGETKDDNTAYMILKQTGTALTGTAGPNADQQWDIQKGKIEGSKVTFEINADGPALKFELTLADGHLKGNANAELDGKTIKAAVDVQRKKE